MARKPQPKKRTRSETAAAAAAAAAAAEGRNAEPSNGAAPADVEAKKPKLDTNVLPPEVEIKTVEVETKIVETSVTVEEETVKIVENETVPADAEAKQAEPDTSMILVEESKIVENETVPADAEAKQAEPDTSMILVEESKIVESEIVAAKEDSDAVAEQKKRARVEGEDGAAVQTTEPSNDAVEAKKAKLDTSVPLEEKAKTLESEDVATKDDSGAVVKEKKSGPPPGGGKEGKKRKVAMLLAYCGANYQGMQRNPGAITIEGELEQALFRANAIAKCNFGDLKKVDWMRAARTDKGVSAIGQIVSAKLVIDPPGLVERVNEHLPKDIRVFGYTRVTTNFNAKQMCDKRRYEYLVPVFAFDPHAHHDRETMLMWNERKENARLQRIEKRKALEQKDAGAAADTTNAVTTEAVTEGEVTTTVVEEVTTEVTTVVKEVEMEEVTTEVTTVVKEVEMEETPLNDEESEREPFVFDEEKLKRLNDILGRYAGTHNFHNFTARIRPDDPSAKRYILSFEAGPVVEVQGMQFVPCTVVGQSFMLHQIRKMIGTAIAIMRGCVPQSIINFALKRNNDVNTPMAPELGLFLDECYYTAYNDRYGGSHEELSQKGYEEKIENFKQEVIYPHIASTEAKDGTMALWLHSLNDRHYPYFETHRAAAAARKQ